LVCNHKVHRLPAQQLAAISDRVPLLALEADTGRRELETERSRVDCFQRSRPELPMHGDAAANGVVHQLFDIFRQRTWNPEHLSSDLYPSFGFRVFAFS